MFAALCSRWLVDAGRRPPISGWRQTGTRNSELAQRPLALSQRVLVVVNRCSQRLISCTSVVDLTGLVLHGISSFSCGHRVRNRTAYIFHAVAQETVNFVELQSRKCNSLSNSSKVNSASWLLLKLLLQLLAIRGDYINVDTARPACRRASLTNDLNSPISSSSACPLTGSRARCHGGSWRHRGGGVGNGGDCGERARVPARMYVRGNGNRL